MEKIHYLKSLLTFSACLRGTWVALFAVMSVLPALCQMKPFTIDGYTLVAYRSGEGTLYRITDVADDALTEARATGLLIIPEYLTKNGEKYIVSEIGKKVFYGKGLEELEEIILPSQCRGIGEMNFIEMPNLRKVQLGNKLDCISHYNFCDMPYLEEFNLPETFRVMRSNCLVNIGVKELNFPPQFCRILCDHKGPSISNLPNLESLSLGNLGMMDGAVYDLPRLTTVTIPGTCISVSHRGLTKMPSLKSLRFAKRTATEFQLYTGSFSECPELTDYYVEDLEPFAVSVIPFPYENEQTVPYSRCTLHVPVGAKEAYSMAPFWRDFGTIVEDAAGMEAVEADNAGDAVKWYSVDGREIDPSTFRGIALRRSGSKVTKQVIR